MDLRRDHDARSPLRRARDGARPGRRLYFGDSTADSIKGSHAHEQPPTPRDGCIFLDGLRSLAVDFRERAIRDGGHPTMRTGTGIGDVLSFEWRPLRGLCL